MVSDAWNSAIISAIACVRGDGDEDITVKCQDMEWKVHRHIMAMHSSSLRDMCRKAVQDGKANIIELKDDLPGCIDLLINYCYTSEYETQYFPDLIDDSQEGVLLFHCMICILAHKYNVSHLKLLAEHKFEAAIKTSKKMTILPAEIITAAIAAYTNLEATKKIRSLILLYVVASGSIITKPEDFKVLEKFPAFGHDLSRALLQRYKDGQEKIKDKGVEIERLSRLSLDNENKLRKSHEVVIKELHDKHSKSEKKAQLELNGLRNEKMGLQNANAASEQKIAAFQQQVAALELKLAVVEGENRRLHAQHIWECGGCGKKLQVTGPFEHPGNCRWGCGRTMRRAYN